MLQNPDLSQSLDVLINIMADKCQHFLSLLDIFQNRRPVTMKVFTYLEDLQVVFAATKGQQYEACAEYFKGCNLAYTTKTQILSTVSEAYEYAEEKLSKYMSHGQPAIEFYKEVRVFDPCYIALLDHSISSYKAIPGVTKVPSDEFEFFKTIGQHSGLHHQV